MPAAIDWSYPMDTSQIIFGLVILAVVLIVVIFALFEQKAALRRQLAAESSNSTRLDAEISRLVNVCRVLEEEKSNLEGELSAAMALVPPAVVRKPARRSADPTRHLGVHPKPRRKAVR
jgi:hypothetical protein